MYRVKISVTVDPTLLKAVDDFIHRSQGADRSKVIEQALRSWSASQQEVAMIAQYSEPPEQGAELEAWTTIRRSAAGRRLRRE
ncbi:MAG: hypothetical protein M3024_15270 [Candidatus Dormibacteraeota bacterium]|nr:hypothetical protein [Candidatus Dormibacteraeota bacterium]